MADSATSHFFYVLPEVGASDDTWGTKLNGALSNIDAVIAYFATTGSSNAFVVTTGISGLAYVAGQTFRVRLNHAPTGACTFNFDGLGAKTLKKNGSTDIASGDLPSGLVCEIAYDGTNFQLVGGLPGAQPLDATLTALAALTTAAEQYIRATGVDTFTMDSYATVLSNLGALSTASAASTYLSQASAASTYAPLASPNFSGTPTVGSGKAVLSHNGSYASGQVTISSSAPSGGSNGDIWLKT